MSGEAEKIKKLVAFKKKLEKRVGKRVGEWESELIDVGSEGKEHLVACRLPKS